MYTNNIYDRALYKIKSIILINIIPGKCILIYRDLII